MKFPDLSRYRNYDDASIEKDDISLIRQLLKSPKILEQENPIGKFETEFKKYIGSKYAISFSRGRVALSAIIRALQLMPGDEVILPGYTCVVVPNSVIYEGLKPVYCDIELESYGPDINSVRRLITNKTKVILIQHLYGLVCKHYEDLISIAKENNIFIIEDCAQVTGAEYQHVKIGNYGDAAIFSLQHSKIISSGDGGVAVTNDDKIYERLKEINRICSNQAESHIQKVLHSVKSIYYNNYISNYSKMLPKIYYRYNLYRNRTHPINICKQERCGEYFSGYMQKYANSLAILGLNQLKKIDSLNDKRRESASLWLEWAMQNNLKPPHVLNNSKPVYLRYPLLLNENKKNKLFYQKRHNNKIGNWMNNNLTSSEPIHPHQPDPTLLPNASRAISSIINLPCL